MILQQFEIGNVIAGLFSQDFSNSLERLKAAFFNGLVNELKCVSEVKIIDSGIKVKLDEVSGTKSTHTLEEKPFSNVLGE
jgi:hypothetical protein